jgi:peptide/nickel transport system ATP-binding protein
MSTPPLLEVESLGITIGGRSVLDAVSFALGPGEILGLVGASGSGKSLTALAILQLLPARARLSGRIAWRGESLAAKSPAALRDFRGREAAIVFQEPMTALNPLLTIGSQVAETVRLHTACSRRVARGLASDALRRVGLEGDASWLARYPHELSGGQRQRVAIAMAIVLSPALLIADEPTTALDQIAQAQILDLLKNLVASSGMSLLLVSHDLGVIAATAGRVLVLERGRIVEEGATATVLRSPAAPYTRRLLAAARLAPLGAQGGPTSRPGSPPTAPPSDMRVGLRSRAGTAPLLEVRELVREYAAPRRHPWRAAAPRRAVDGVSLCVYPGETVGLIGASGSGKSTLARLILALEAPQSGSVQLLGEPFSTTRGPSLRRLRRAVQIVFQDPYGSLDPEWSVERIVAEPLHLLEIQPSPAERRAQVAAMLESVGLAATDAARHPHEFSGGQRQRMAIARALIGAPALIVFDEAVSALDVLVRAQILELLADLRRRFQVSYLFITHDLEVVRAVADRLYVMAAGRIVEEGPTERVFAAPRHAFTAELVQSDLARAL